MYYVFSPVDWYSYSVYLRVLFGKLSYVLLYKRVTFSNKNSDSSSLEFFSNIFRFIEDLCTYMTVKLNMTTKTFTLTNWDLKRKINTFVKPRCWTFE